MKTADIHPLPGLPWNARAALADAQNRMDADAELVIIAWKTPDGRYKSNFVGNNGQVVWFLERLKLDAMGVFD